MHLLALLLLLLPLAASAQQRAGTLVGRVLNTKGEGLPGAVVILEGTTLGAEADSTGRYRVIGIPAGEYAVTAYLSGFYGPTARATVTYVQPRTVDFVLTEGEIGYSDYFPAVDCMTPMLSDDPFASRVVSDNCGSSVWLSDLPVER